MVYFAELFSSEIRRLAGLALSVHAPEQHLDEHARPRVRRVGRDNLIQRFMPQRLFLGRHLETLVHRGGYVLTMIVALVRICTHIRRTYTEIPGIDQKCIFHMLADSHELTQHERRIICFALRDHKFHAGGVHPVPEGCDHSKVSHAQQSVEFVFLQCLVAVIHSWLGSGVYSTGHALMMDGNKVQTSILAVDMGYELVDLPLELRGISQRRGCHLDHDHIPDPLWVVLQEFLKRTELCDCLNSRCIVGNTRCTF